MASGTFKTPMYNGAPGYSRNIYVKWSSTNDTTNNKSTIKWEAYAGSDDASTGTYVEAKHIKITINGTTVYQTSGENVIYLYKDRLIASGTTTAITHNTDGTKSVPVHIEALILRFYTGELTNNEYTGSISMTRNPVYSLNINAGSGSSIVVNRTQCAGVGSTGVMTAGTKKLCKGDSLKITFSASSGYSVTTHTVNGSSFTSGNTHTVSGNVSVVSAASQPLSTGTASNAYIGSNCVITVNRKSTNYTHTIAYKFVNLQGVVVSKSTATNIDWSVPLSLYDQIPNAKSAVCVFTITTYSGDTSLGSTTFSAVMTGNSSVCAPTVTGTVVDSNNITTYLTGDSSVIVRGRSDALCTITASGYRGATIASKTVNDISIINSTTLSSVSDNKFVFKATDTRGFSKTYTIVKSMIPYVPLTIVPSVTRNFQGGTSTDSGMLISFSGNYFNGSFGEHTNTLTIRYRYRQSNGAFGSWTTLTAGTDYTISTSSFKTNRPIEITGTFDRQQSYIFEFNAFDGDSSHKLTDITKNVTVNKSIPIFDWGKNDFNFDVEVKVRNKNIKDMSHPVGSVVIVANGQIGSASAVRDAYGFGTWQSMGNFGHSGITFYLRIS